MDRNTARVVGAIFGTIAVLLVVLATVVRYSGGKPTDYTALMGALFCLFFMVLVLRDRGQKQ